MLNCSSSKSSSIATRIPYQQPHTALSQADFFKCYFWTGVITFSTMTSFLCLYYTSAWNGKHLWAEDLHMVIFVFRSLETRKQLWRAVLQMARAQHLKGFLCLLSAYLNPPAHQHQAPQAHQNLHYPLLCLHQPKQACQIQSKPVQGG